MPLYAATIMTTNVISAKPNDTVGQVARLLATHHISAVPVCEADGTLLSMVSEGDLMRPFATETEARRAWWLRPLAEGTDLAPEFLTYTRQDQRRARDLMTPQVVSVTENTSAREIADQLMTHHVKRVPVVCEGRWSVSSPAPIWCGRSRRPRMRCPSCSDQPVGQYTSYPVH